MRARPMALLIGVVGALALGACSSSQPSAGPAPSAPAPPPSGSGTVLVPHRLVDRLPPLEGRPTTEVGVRIQVPQSWSIQGGSSRSLVVREGTPACTYEVTFAVEAAHTTDRTAEAAVASDLPVGTGSLLESGRRGSAAWRIVRRVGAEPITVVAVRAQPARTAIPGDLGRWWLLTRVTARALPESECHAGTYRDVLGPALGDTLATARATR